MTKNELVVKVEEKAEKYEAALLLNKGAKVVNDLIFEGCLTTDEEGRVREMVTKIQAMANQRTTQARALDQEIASIIEREMLAEAGV